MHDTEAVTEPRRADLREDQMAKTCLPDLAQPLDEGVIDQAVAVHRVPDTAAVRHGGAL